MEPQETGRAYDRIAAQWVADEPRIQAGLPYLERAIAACRRRGAALDVGCGTGRLLPRLVDAGFDVTGLDVSHGMLEQARRRHPGIRLVQADVAAWEPDRAHRAYDLILCWDSTFHLPKRLQEPVLRKLCRLLAPGGILLFTAGGQDGEVTGPMHGERFAYSSLSDEANMRILASEGCQVELLEHDQRPEAHAVFIARKAGPGAG